MFAIPVGINWLAFFASSPRHRNDLWWLILTFVFFILLVVATIKTGRSPTAKLSSVAGLAMFMVMYLVLLFAALYYRYGGAGNWNHPLSHLDAVLLAIGTLTTAGTGDLHSQTELARGLLALQMAIDVITFTVAAAVVLHRFTADNGDPSAAPEGHAAK